MPVDVLDRHRRVVDQYADRQSEAAQCHDVERFSECGEDRDRAKHRQRDRCGDDDGGPPAPEEDQDHQAGERRGDDPLLDDAVDGTFDEERLIADQRYVEIVGKQRL